MKLTIYPKSKSHPKTKEEKHVVAMETTKPTAAEVANFSSDEELINLITSYAWSPFVFNGTRHGDNFYSCDLLVYDIDKGMTIDEAEDIIKQRKLCALCLPSPNHSPENHRFRLILPLAGTIFSRDQYEDTWKSGAEMFPAIDPSCCDLARWYCGSTDVDGFWNDGELFEPIRNGIVKGMDLMKEAQKKAFRNVKVTDDIQETITSIYGKPRLRIPEAVEFFVKNAKTGIPGNWICSLNSACFSLALSGVEDSAIMDAMEKLAPNELDKRDLDQIKRAIRDGKKYREHQL